MSMTPMLYSLNSLSVELGKDRRTLAKLLATVKPNGEVRGHPAWYILTALEVLGWAGQRSHGQQLGDIQLDSTQELARKNKELADKTALQNEVTRGTLIEIDFVHRFVTAAFSRVRSKMLAIPSKLAPVVIHLDSIPEAQAKLTAAVHDALNELSETVVVGGREPGPDSGDASGLVDLQGSPEPECERVGRPRKKIEPRVERGAGTVGYEPG